MDLLLAENYFQSQLFLSILYEYVCVYIQCIYSTNEHYYVKEKNVLN